MKEESKERKTVELQVEKTVSICLGKDESGKPIVAECPTGTIKVDPSLR